MKKTKDYDIGICRISSFNTKGQIIGEQQIRNRARPLSKNQRKDLELFVKKLCQETFKSFLDLAIEKGSCEVLLETPNQTFSLYEIKKQLNFLPTDEVILDFLGEESLKYSHTFNLSDNLNQVYVHFHGAGISEGKLALSISGIIVEKTLKKKRFFWGMKCKKYNFPNN